MAQGDLLLAPIGIFFPGDDVEEDGPRPEPGDTASTHARLPWRIGGGQLAVRVWYLPAVVVTPDCGVDKRPQAILVAPLVPLAMLTQEAQAGVRKNTFLTALLLPSDPAIEAPDGTTFPLIESVVDLTRITPLAPELVESQRFAALTAHHVERLQYKCVGFFANRELSGTGTISAVVGKTVKRVAELESKQGRHTAALIFEDDTTVVVFIEPRRRGHWESVSIKSGLFSIKQLQALTETDLVIRFENEDDREWNVSCESFGLTSTKIAPKDTTHVRVACPNEPAEALLINQDKPPNAIIVRVITAQ